MSLPVEIFSWKSHIVYLSFDVFAIGGDPKNCSGSYVEIFDGIESNADRIVLACGTKSLGSILDKTINFLSDFEKNWTLKKSSANFRDFEWNYSQICYRWKWGWSWFCCNVWFFDSSQEGKKSVYLQDWKMEDCYVKIL